MCDLVDQEPTSYEDDAHKKEWVDDERIQVNNEEWCLGYSTQTKKQECGIFKMDIQDKTCC